MKISAALINKWIRLAKGETLPASSLKGDWVEQMQTDGILATIVHGSRKSLRAGNERSFRSYLASHYDIRDLEAYHGLLISEESDRATQVSITGSSKFMPQRTFYGFLVNAYQTIHAELNGRAITIVPQEGTFTFIYDYKAFRIPEDVIIIGIENPENFRWVRAQRRLFESVVPKDAKILFVSRYPQSQSKDLICWLQSIPNRYVHWGDLDLAGIHIYLSEFHKYLGERASLLIPDDYECRISKGSHERYDGQLSKFGKLDSKDLCIKALLDCIHRYHRGYDQEGYIKDLNGERVSD